VSSPIFSDPDGGWEYPALDSGAMRGITMTSIETRDGLN
jgi:hypothetical protein